MIGRKGALACGACLAALFGGSEALAQSTSDVGEVVVTATRRAELLSRVPVSATAVTEQAIDRKGMRTFEDIARLTPGVEFSRGSNLISIRGISTSAGAATTGVYIDETPIQTRNIGTGRTNGSPQLFDVERVEVLRGPQGTLFGAGSMGGTVRYITPQPSLTDWSYYGRGEVNSIRNGDTGYEVGAAVGGPVIADKLGVRVSAWRRRSGGWIDRIDYLNSTPANPVMLENNSNWEEHTILRGALRWEPVDGLTIKPSVLFQETFANNAPVLTGGVWEYYSDIKNGKFRSGNKLPSPVKEKYVLPALEIERDFDAFSLVSNTSYFHRNQTTNSDYTAYLGAVFGFVNQAGPAFQRLPTYYSYADVVNQQRNFTQELRLQSNGEGRLKWVAGVFFQENKQRSYENIHDPLIAPFTQIFYGQTVIQRYLVPVIAPDLRLYAQRDSTDRQLAAFGDLTFNLTDELSISGGLRYAKMDFKFHSLQEGPTQRGRTEFDGNLTEKPLTPKFNVTYQPAGGGLIYATAAKGYRAGGSVRPAPALTCAADFAALGVTSLPPTFKSDSVWSYEVGAKNNLADGRLRIAASAYHVDWKDIQTSIGLPTCGFNYVANAGTARSRGFDLQAEAQVTDALSLTLAVAHNSAKFTSTVDAPGTIPGVRRIIVSEGNTLGGAPWTVALSADYNFQAFGLPSYVRGDFSYAAKNKGRTPAQDPRTTSYDATVIQPPDTYITNARVGVLVNDLDLSVFADNLFDSHPVLSRFHETRTSPLYMLSTFRPRTVGVTVTIRR
ncbi:TonB-dependent receptor [Phenylobacterium sp.]|jgi:iron complex outermembrane receptor protein|uniref:TonB-dependent receptor n=1 Tax=Phenylobacterium sp. TaxID=1871053 RepID=UPI003783EB73